MLYASYRNRNKKIDEIRNWCRNSAIFFLISMDQSTYPLEFMLSSLKAAGLLRECHSGCILFLRKKELLPSARLIPRIQYSVSNHSITEVTTSSPLVISRFYGYKGSWLLFLPIGTEPCLVQSYTQGLMYNLRIPRVEGKFNTFLQGPRNLNNEAKRLRT